MVGLLMSHEGIANLYKIESEDYMWLEMANFTNNNKRFYYFLSLLSNSYDY